MMLNPRPSLPPIGWPLLSVPDAAGELHYPALAESVRDNLKVILSTRPGEQLMRPTYGGGLTEFIGQPDTLTTRRRIHDRVTESVGRWEPRVELAGVELSEVPRQPGHLRIHLTYRLRRTGETRSFGVNLQLEA